MPSLSSEMGSESQASQMLRLVTEDDSSSGSAFSKQNDASNIQSSNDIPESVPTEDVAPQFYLYGFGESQSQRQGDDSFVGGSQKENLGSSGSGSSSSQGGSQAGTLAEARVNAPAPAKARAEMAPPLLITSSKSPQPSTTSDRRSRSPHLTASRSRLPTSRSKPQPLVESQRSQLLPESQPQSVSQEPEMGDVDWARSPTKDAHGNRLLNRKNSIISSQTSDVSKSQRSEESQRVNQSQLSDDFSQIGRQPDESSQIEQRQPDDMYDDMPMAQSLGGSNESQAVGQDDSQTSSHPSQVSSHTSALRLYANSSREEDEDELVPTQLDSQPSQLATPPPDDEPTQLETQMETQIETQIETQLETQAVDGSNGSSSAAPLPTPTSPFDLFSMTADQVRGGSSAGFSSAARSHVSASTAPSPVIPSSAVSAFSNQPRVPPLAPPPVPSSAASSRASATSAVSSNASPWDELLSKTEDELRAERLDAASDVASKNFIAASSSSTSSKRKAPTLWDSLSKEKRARMKPPPMRPAAQAPVAAQSAQGSVAAQFAQAPVATHPATPGVAHSATPGVSDVATAGSSGAPASDRDKPTQLEEPTQPADVETQPAVDTQPATQPKDEATQLESQPSQPTGPADEPPLDDMRSSQEVCSMLSSQQRPLLSSPEQPLWQPKHKPQSPLTPRSEVRSRSPAPMVTPVRVPLRHAVADSTPQRQDEEVPDSEPMREPLLEHRDVPNTSDDKMDVDEEGEEEEQDGDKTVQAIVPEPDEGDRVTEPDEEDSATEPASEPEEPSSDFEQSIPLMEVVYGDKAKKVTKTKGKGRAVEPEPKPAPARPKGKGKQRAMPPPARVTRGKRQRLMEPGKEEEEGEEELQPPPKPARRGKRGFSRAASGSRKPAKAPASKRTRSGSSKKAKEEEVVEDSEGEDQQDFLPDVQQLTEEPEQLSDYDGETNSGSKRKRVIKAELTGLSRSSRSTRMRTASMTPGPSRHGSTLTPSGSVAQLLGMGQATRVFARWKLHGDYYAGFVKEVVRPGKTYRICFDDGSVADASVEHMRLFILQTGDEVLVRNKRSFVVDARRMYTEGRVRVKSPDDETEEDEGEDLSLKEFCISAKVIEKSWTERRVQADNIRAEEDLASSALAPSPSRSSLRSIQEPTRGVFDRIAFVLTLSSDPGAKDSYEKLIVANGGVVLTSWDEVLEIQGKTSGAGPNARWVIQREACSVRYRSTYDKLFLLSCSDMRTIKFLTALACGVPCVRQDWVTESLVRSKLQDWRQYLLPQGLSVTLNMTVTQMVDVRWGEDRAHLDLLHGKPGKLRLLDDLRIALVGRDLMPRANAAANSKAEPGIAKVLICMGARSVEVVSREQAIANRLGNFDLIILRTGENTSTSRPASLRSKNVCSWDWAKDCLSLSRPLPYTWPAED